MLKDYFILFSHNIVVEGKEKSAIYDLQHGKIYKIPSIFREIILELRERPLRNVRQKYAPDKPELFDKYIDFLLKKDLGFYADNPDEFPLLGLQWNSPTIIQNSIIEYSFDNFDFENTISQLDELLCRHIELRLDIRNCVPEKILQKIRFIENTVIRSLQIIISYDILLTETFAEQIFLASNKISGIIIYGAPNNKKHPAYPQKIIYLVEDFKNTRFNRSVLTQIISIPYFTESLKYNSYYNQKVCISATGSIKNCLRHEKIFGNVNTDPIKACVLNSDFRELWLASPDRIVELKDSELRYCTFVTNSLKKLESGEYSLISDQDLSYELRK